MTDVRRASAAFHVMSKPTGAVCNLDCECCFFLSKEQLYLDSDFRMSPEVHEAYLAQLFAAHPVDAGMSIVASAPRPVTVPGRVDPPQPPATDGYRVCHVRRGSTRHRGEAHAPAQRRHLAW